VKGLLESRDSAELRHIIDCLGIAAFIIDVVEDNEFRLAAINKRHEKLTGMQHDKDAGRTVDEILSPEMAEHVKAKYRQCVRERKAIDYQETLELPIGTTYWRTTLVPYMDTSGRAFRLLGTSIEISSTIHLELDSRYQATLLGAYLDESPDGILVVDANNHMKTWNKRFLEVWNIPESIMQSGDGARALEAALQQLKEPEGFIARVLELYQHLDEEERNYRVEMLDGRVYDRYSRGLRDSQGTYWGRIWFYRDVTEHERMTHELQRLAWTDVLTQTTNRRAFMQILADEYQRAHRYHHPLTIMMLDLDEFKLINDRYGHAGGDATLIAFADTVRPLLRSSDQFARMGGEEFAILLPETELAKGTAIAERICREVANITLENPNGDFGITTSIGVTEMHTDDTDAESLLNRADRILYEAKAAGRNRVANG
jgi:diguanylate cyclase (GGDEF)-like protein/PAS domain S-box-containing protein